MRINAIALKAAAIAAVLMTAGAARADQNPLGVWIDHTGRGAVEIKDCGGRLCGYVAWVKDPKDAEGCGEQIIGDVKPVGGNVWDNGWIYDPDRDDKFDVELTPIGADKLQVMGYAGTKWLSETMTWKRAPADLATCAKPGTAAQAAAKDAPETTVAAPEVKSDKPQTQTMNKTAAKTDDDMEADVEADKETAAVVEDEVENEEPADKPKKKRRAKEFIAKFAEALDKSEFGSRSGGTCRVQLPYVDMMVKFPCDR